MNGTSLFTCCVNASSVNMFKSKVNTFLRKAGYTWVNNVGLSISQWFPCPLAIWAFALDGSLFNLFNVIQSALHKDQCCCWRLFSWSNSIVVLSLHQNVLKLCN